MQQEISPAPIFVGFIFLLIAGTFWFRAYTGLSREKAYLALVASIIAGGLRSYYRSRPPYAFADPAGEFDVYLGVVLAAGVLIVFATAFVLRLWGRWIGENATAEERLPGIPGIRAWFSAGNVFVGAMIVICAWLGDHFSPLAGVFWVGALLAAQPLLRMESPALTAVASAPEDLSPEREKIVSMLEAGKLTPEESAELLQALGDTARRPVHQVPLTSGQRLLLIGATLVTVGFFLPWFVINPGKEASRMMQQAQSSVSSSFDGQAGITASLPVPNMPIGTADVSISGGDIQRGLGWAALGLALAAAILPYVATTLDTATTRTVRLLCLGVGGLIVLYLLTQNLRFASIGLMIAIGGYVVEIAGVVREPRAAEA